MDKAAKKILIFTILFAFVLNINAYAKIFAWKNNLNSVAYISGIDL